MNFISKVKEYFTNKMESNAYDKQKLAELRKEINIQAQIDFEKEYRLRALEVARAKAIKDAQTLSGYKRLQAINTVNNLENPSKGTFLSKMAEYTQKNRARTQANLERTKLIRQVAQEERLKREENIKLQRQARINKIKQYGSYI